MPDHPHEPPHEPPHKPPHEPPHEPPHQPPHQPPHDPPHGPTHAGESGTSANPTNPPESSGPTQSPPGSPSHGSPTAPPSGGHGAAAPPATALTTAATSLAKLAKYPDVGSIGQPGGAGKVEERFRNASDTLGASWADYQGKFLGAEKKRVQDADLSWTKEGYDAVVKKLPDIEKTLEDWQALKDKNPFDSDGFTKLADQLATQVHEFQWLIENGARFSSAMTMSLSKGLEAICAEVARQAISLNDPVKSVTADLDSLSSVLSARARTKFDQALKSSKPDEVWTRAKDALLPGIKDKAVAKDVKGIFSEDLGDELSSWSKRIKPPIDGSKLTAANRALADKLGSYDRQLADIEARNMDMKSASAVGGLREVLHAIAARISHDTNWVVSQGAFGPPR